MGHIPDEELVSVYRVQRDHWKAIWKARAEKAERERDDALDDARRSHNLVVQFQKDGAKMRVLLDRAIEIVEGEFNE